MAEQGGDGLEAHAAVDGLGGEGVSELVRCHVPDASCLCGLRDGAVYPILPDAPAAGDQQIQAFVPATLR